MTIFERAIEVISNAKLPGRTLHPLQVEALVQLLKDEGLLMPDTQVIHELEELGTLDLDTVFMNSWEDLFDVNNVNNVQASLDSEDFPYYFPCSIVATGDQVRAAREALEKK